MADQQSNPDDLAVSGKLRPCASDDMHSAIMNIPCPNGIEGMHAQRRLDYKAGHRDARHAAAELVSVAIAVLETQLASAQRVARAAKTAMDSMEQRMAHQSRQMESLRAQAADVAGERAANAVLTNRVERLEAAIAQGERP